MSQDATVNAGDIARLVDVGKAAVSNWRRRHDDFPQPVGGTASSPLFSLREVEDWLRRNGKTFQVSLADRTWQRLRAADDDLRLGELVAAAGELLTGTRSAPLPDAGLVALITELAEERGPADAFEFLCTRYQEAHSRRLFTTPADVAALMVELVAPPSGTVFDPTCGLGTLLLAAPAGTQRRGQELNDTAASIAATRLLLSGADATVTTGDSLRADGFPDELADAVVCDPPFNERAWGYQELTGDPRWEYGLPPRGESELAWVQHCVAHTRPGGLAAVLMPAAAAGRRPGKRIRGNLLRAGVLRAIVSLAVGGPDLWLLRRPLAGDRPPSHLLLMTAHDDLATVVPAWRRHLREPDEGAAVRIIDLLDDDVDLSPTRRRTASTGDELVRELGAATRSLRAIGLRPPEFDVPKRRQALPVTTIGELVKAGLLTVRHAPARMATDAGDVPVLTADDLAEDRPPSGRTTTDEPGLVTAVEGDVVASVLGAARVLTSGNLDQTPADDSTPGEVDSPAGGVDSIARVAHSATGRVGLAAAAVDSPAGGIDSTTGGGDSPASEVEPASGGVDSGGGGVVLGPYLARYRVDPQRLDPDFLAGILRAAEPATHSGSSRIDVRRIQVPRLPLAEQRRYGAAFRELLALADAVRTARVASETLVRLGFDGLVAGHLRPVD